MLVIAMGCGAASPRAPKLGAALAHSAKTFIAAASRVVEWAFFADARHIGVDSRRRCSTSLGNATWHRLLHRQSIANVITPSLEHYQSAAIEGCA